MSKKLREELSPHNVRVIVIAPCLPQRSPT
ncbi:hypothetical protein ACWXVW_00670 [Pantoea dispersa]